MTLPLLVRLRAAMLTAVCWLMLLPAARAQFVIDGALDSAYTRYPLALQAAPTLVGDATNTTQLTADGSELDGVYARLRNGNLYLFLPGNLESNGTALELFFDTKAGGQARLLSNNPNVDGNGLNAMAGLRFEPGFEPDYYLTVKIDGGTISASYATLGNTPNTGGLVGTGTSSPVTLTLPGGSGTLGIDNSNIAGVTDLQPSAPSRVGTGIELLLPLSALGNPAGNFRMSAFINAPGHTSISNQVLGAMPQLRDNLGAPQDVDFSLYPGNQTVLLQTAPNGFGHPMLGLSGAAEVFFSPMPFNASGYGIDLVLRSLGGFGIGISNIQFSNPAFSTTFSGAVPGGGQRTMTIVYRPTTAGAHAGTLTFNTTDPNQPTVTIPLAGIATGSSAITVDGTQGTDYSAAAALQTTPTGFGDNQSELNGAYARVQNNTLYLLLTGNLEANGNPLELFFDAGTGGQNILANNNPDIDNNGLNRMAGLRFDPAFEPEYYLTIRHQTVGGIPVITGNFATLLGASGTGRLLTFQARGSAMVLNFANGEAGQVAINNTNTAGVTATAVGNPSGVTTGIELAIPFAALGFPTADFKVAAFVNGVGHTFVSNQVLAGLPNGTANLGAPATVNFAAQAGNQFFVVPNGGSPSGPDITVSPAPLAFGSVAVGGSGTLTLNINNPGTAPLTISGITSSDAAFTVSPTTGTVPAGGSLSVTVTFRPTSAGPWGTTLTIASNAPSSPTTVAATGTGTAVSAPVLGLSATSLAFGNVNTGASATRTFRVRNRGNAPLILSSISSSNARFGASPGVGSVAAGDSLLITVTFAPTAVGAQTGTLTINTNGGTGTVALTGTGIAAPTASVDGTLDAGGAYGAPLAVQTTPTGFGNATAANNFAGSELDAAYARISGGKLYLLLTGNLEANGNDLELFFDTQTGGQNQLNATNPDVDGNGLNRMAGLRFDASFTADYYVTVQQNLSGGQPLLRAHHAALTGAGGTGLTLTSGATGAVQALDFGTFGLGALAIDNTNEAGVDGTTVGNPSAVTTGIELEIPLAALGSPTGAFRIAAFINGDLHNFVSNQVLAGLPNGTANLGDPATVDFNTPAGNQFFTVGGAPGITVTPNPLAIGSVTVGSSGTGILTVTNSGAAPLTITGITSGNTRFTVNPTTATVAVGATVTFTVTFAPTVAGPQTATLSITSNAPSSPTTVTVTGTGTATPAPVLGLSATSLAFGNVNTGASATRTFRIRNRGNATLILSSISSSNTRFGASPGVASVAAGDSLLVTVTFAPTAVGAQTGTLTINTNGGTGTVTLTGTGVTPAVITVDGSLDTGYGAPLAVQTTPTGFGNSTSGSQTVATGGSELDAAYARIDNSVLYLLLTGNLETNGNKLELFFDTRAGGQNQLLNTNPDVDGNGLNRMAGLGFDAGFAPDYYLTLNNTNPAAGFTLAAHFAEVNGAGGTGIALANGPGRTQPLAFSATSTGQVSLDNSNVAGVDDTALGNPAAVTTGIELAIPLAALGNPAGPILISAFINGAQHDFLSNQVLAGLPSGTPNLGAPATANYGAAANAGQQFFTVANGAAVPVIGVGTTNLTFSTQPGVPTTRTFTVRNTGNAPLNVTGYTISNAAFAAAPATATVAPGDSVVVTVTFTSATAGTFTGTLTVRSNDAITPAPVLALTASVILGLPTDLIRAVHLAPNPATDHTTLYLPSGLLADSPTMVAIVDGLGRTVRSTLVPTAGSPEATVVLDLQGLPRAVYYIRLQTAAGVLVRRLAIE